VCRDARGATAKRNAWRTLLACTALALIAPAAASAYPASHGLRKTVLSHRAAPQTATCEQGGSRCFLPAQVQHAYDTTPLYREGYEGQGETIVIVDSFGSPTIQHDLSVFDSAYSLPEPPSLEVIQPAGQVARYRQKNVEMVGWAAETTIDVECAHLIAPAARILLVETPVAETQGVQGFPQIVAAENYVIEHHLGQVISQSFGSGEDDFPDQNAIRALRSANVNAAAAGVTMLAAAGDNGVDEEDLEGGYFSHREQSWPSSDPLVTSVGGTQMHLDAAGERVRPDTVWKEVEPTGVSYGGGGGPSHVFGRPAYQQLLETGSGAYRATPDISMNAGEKAGLVVFSSFRSKVEGEPDGPTFWDAAGTSVATPLFAGVVALLDQVAGHPLGEINPALYQLAASAGWGASGLVDVTEGNNTFLIRGEEGETLLRVAGFRAKPGYDMASGLGTVDAYRLAHSLAGH